MKAAFARPRRLRSVHGVTVCVRAGAEEWNNYLARGRGSDCAAISRAPRGAARFRRTSSKPRATYPFTSAGARACLASGEVPEDATPNMPDVVSSSLRRLRWEPFR